MHVPSILSTSATTNNRASRGSFWARPADLQRGIVIPTSTGRRSNAPHTSALAREKAYAKEHTYTTTTTNAKIVTNNDGGAFEASPARDRAGVGPATVIAESPSAGARYHDERDRKGCRCSPRGTDAGERGAIRGTRPCRAREG